MEVDYGVLSVLPPLVAIILCFITKRVLVSLFIGVLTGGIIISTGNPFLGLTYTFDKIVVSMTDEWNTRLLIFNLLMGSGVAFIWRLGGSSALTKWARSKIKTKSQAGIGAWILGIVVFFNDMVNAAIVGNVFRDVYEEKKISKEKLSYILDSTAAPVATFFISDWIAFQIGMIQSGMDAAGIEGNAFTSYLQGIPFNIYCIFAVLFVGIIVISKKDFGPMYFAEKRARTTGKTIRDDASPMMDVGLELGKAKEDKPMLKSFFLPLFALVGVTLFGFYWTGKDGGGFTEILGASDPSKALLWGAFAMTFTGAFIALSNKLMKLKEVMETIIDGMKIMLLACSILVLAWSLGGITKDLKLAGYLITIIGDSIPFTIFPLIVFILGMVIAFSTGTSWGAMTILTPVAIPMAYSMTGDVYLSVVMGGIVFSGAIFGDHCSPISDTTVMASIFSGSDHMDHVSTQIPYALVCALVASIMYLLFGFFNINPFILIVVGLMILISIPYLLGNYYEKK